MGRSARESDSRSVDVRQGLVDEPLTLDQLHKLAALDDILTFLVLGREYAWENWPRRTLKVDLGTIDHGVDILTATREDLRQTLQKLETAESKYVAMSKVADELSQIREDSSAAMTQIKSERDEAVKEKDEAVKEMEESFRTHLAELLAAKKNEETALKEAETLRSRLADVLAEQATLESASRTRTASKATFTAISDQVDKGFTTVEGLNRQMETMGYARDAAVQERDRLMERRTKDVETHKKELDGRDAKIRMLEGRLAELDNSRPLGPDVNTTVTNGTPPRRHQPLPDADSVTRSPTARELSDHATIKRRIKQQGIEIRALRNANRVLQSRNDSTAQSSEDILSVSQNIERRNIELQARMEDIVRAVVGPRSMSDGSVSVVPVSYHLAVQMNRIADISLRGAGVVLPEKERGQGRRLRVTASLPTLQKRDCNQEDDNRVEHSSSSRLLATGLPVSATRTSSIAPYQNPPNLPQNNKPTSGAGNNIPRCHVSVSTVRTRRRVIASPPPAPGGPAGSEDGGDQTDCEGQVGKGNGSEASIPPSSLLNGETGVSGGETREEDREPEGIVEGQQADKQESGEAAEQRWRGLPAIRLPS